MELSRFKSQNPNSHPPEGALIFRRLCSSRGQRCRKRYGSQQRVKDPRLNRSGIWWMKICAECSRKSRKTKSWRVKLHCDGHWDRLLAWNDRRDRRLLTLSSCSVGFRWKLGRAHGELSRLFTVGYVLPPARHLAL